MPSAALALHPATPCSALRGIEISISRKDGALKVSYSLQGEIARLRIPPPRPPRVAERLWQHTCFEIFIARDGASGYRELNFSPSGEWAAYSFDAYRQGRLDAGSADPGIRVQRAPGRLELVASIPVTQHGKLRVGLSAVIEEESGGLSYWALRHAPGKPDFHHPEAFALELDEVRH